MNIWYRFWYSRVGLGLMGVFALYWAWAVFKNPTACSLGNLDFLICSICKVFGNLAASAFLALLAVAFIYFALRPERSNWA